MILKPVLFLCAAVLPGLALADFSTTPPPSLGIVHAILDVCSKVDPRDDSIFDAEWTSIVGHETALERSVEQSTSYKQAYEWMVKMLETTPREQLAKTCAVGNHAVDTDGSRPPDRPPTHVTVDDSKAHKVGAEPLNGRPPKGTKTYN